MFVGRIVLETKSMRVGRVFYIGLRSCEGGVRTRCVCVLEWKLGEI